MAEDLATTPERIAQSLAKHRDVVRGESTCAFEAGWYKATCLSVSASLFLALGEPGDIARVDALAEPKEEA
jgi:hypothetical protein